MTLEQRKLNLIQTLFFSKDAELILKIEKMLKQPPPTHNRILGKAKGLVRMKDNFDDPK